MSIAEPPPRSQGPQGPGHTPLITPPHNLEAEQAVLGAVLLSDTVLTGLIVDENLHAEDFYREGHAVMFQAMRELSNKGQNVDRITLEEHLRQNGMLEAAGGTEAIDLLAGPVPAVGHARQYAGIVRENAMLRRLLRASYEITERVANREAAPRELVDLAERAILEVAQTDRRKDFRKIEDLLMTELEKLAELSAAGKSITGTRSGFVDLDTITGGFQPGNLVILAARPSMGKSSFMANIAENAALGDAKAVALFSLEMSEGELAQRFIASQASVKGDDLSKGRVPQTRWGKIMEASNKLAASALYIDDSSDLSVLDVRAKARRLAQQHPEGLSLILIDYLQLMRADGATDNRVEQIGQISRGLKSLARELEVPVIALSQLNRGVEQRTDKRPVLSDLRESGCLAGETLVHLPETGEYKRMDELVGTSGFKVSAVDPDSLRLEAREVTRAFSTGVKPVSALRTRLGRRVRATGNHRFLTVDGWRRLDELQPGDHVALPRELNGPSEATLTDAQLALLGHLIGDGCTLPRHSIQYTTREPELARVVASAATAAFGDRIAPTIKSERTWTQVYLAATEHLTHGRRNPIAEWFDALGIFGLRSHQKSVPRVVFAQPRAQVATFLRHLWATDGCVWAKKGRIAVYYATSSERLARDVQSLLLRLGITAALSQVPQRNGRDQFHVRITGRADTLRFVDEVGAVGYRREASLASIREHLTDRGANTNRDVIPRSVWHSDVRPAMREQGVTERSLQAALGMQYCGTTLYKTNLSRERTARVAQVLGHDRLEKLAAADVYWDRIESIEPDGEAEVFDLTVEGLHNFVAGDVVVHNSIEQDADLVMFIYRDEYYHPEETEDEGLAELIISKHRNGGLGKVKLTFQKEYPRFMSYVGEEPY